MGAPKPTHPSTGGTGPPHLFKHNMIKSLRADSIHVFETEHKCTSSGSPSHEASSVYYVMRLGKTKVLAIDRIFDMVLNPPATESLTIHVKKILKDIVRCAAAVRTLKCTFLKAFAVFLMEDHATDLRKSIWVSSEFDSTPKCWNVRITKLKDRATKLFQHANFPDDPSNPRGRSKKVRIPIVSRQLQQRSSIYI
jgi:hypothetical protein